MHILIGLFIAFVLLALFGNRKTRKCRWRRDRSADRSDQFMYKCMMCGAETFTQSDGPPQVCLKDYSI